MDILQTMCEKDAMLIREKDRALMEAVGEREKVAVMVMGKMRDTGRMVAKESKTGQTGVLGELPKKPFVDHPVTEMLPEDLRVMQALDRVLRLLSVGSKCFLWLLWLVTSKVERSVRGLMSPFSTTGCATAMGEPAGECGVGVLRGGGRGDGGSGHGGKDSLWMAAKVGEEVVSVYAGCPDISLTVTPDIKHTGCSSLVLVDLSGGHTRLGGSALVQTFKQLGDATPDCDTALLKRAFLATQRLLRERVLLAGHNRSDSGVLTTVLEMCFGGDCGCVMETTTENSVMEFLFNEELGLVVEVPARVMVKTQTANGVKVSVKGAVVLDEDEKALHDLWEAMSFELDKLQSNQEGCL
ncbi:hypothetical protein WA577_001628 [Blastocystis sp. JDR]